MKKRILAFALTLAMVVGSLSMLSFVTFAEDVQDPPAATDFYAYRTTAKIDGAFATDEIFLPVYKEIAPNVAIGMAWDYDNLYFAMYQEPADEETPCAGADRKDFLSSATFNVSGVEIVVNYEAKTVASETEGVKGVVPGTHGLEFSVPLSAITLEATQLAAGVAATDMSFAIIQKQGEAQAENTIEGELNVILSGRSVLAMTNNINPVAPNGYTFGGHVYDRNKGGADSVAGSVTLDGTTMINSWSSQTWHVLDKDVKARSVEFLRNMNHINDFVSVLDSNTGVHVEYELNIANLPVGTVTAIDNISGFANGASNIHVFFEGAHASVRSGVLGYIYNDATNGLSYKYAINGTTLGETVDLGVDFGNTFILGFNATPASADTIKVEVLVNDDVIHTYTAAVGINYGLTGDTGYTCLTYHRGSANGYSLDLDGENGVEDDERVEFTMSGFSLSKLEEVDLEALKTATKGEDGTVATTLLAKTLADSTEYVNIGSVTKAYAYYDYEAKTVTVAVNRQNVDTIKLEVGGVKATVTHSLPVEVAGNPDPVCAKLDSASIDAGITVSCPRPYGVTLVTIPMNKIVITKTGDIATTTLNIEVVNEEQIINDKTRPLCQTVGTWNGTLAFEIAEPEVDIQESTSTPALGTLSAFANAGDGEYTINAANTTAARSYAIAVGNTQLATYGDRTISFNINVTSMKSYAFNGDYSTVTFVADVEKDGNLGVGSSLTSQDFDKLVIGFDATANSTNTAAEAIGFVLVNDASKGLVLLHKNNDDVLTAIDLLDNANASDDLSNDIAIKINWNIDDTATVYVNGSNSGTTFTNAITVYTADSTTNFQTWNGSNSHKGILGFNYMRATSSYSFVATISSVTVTTTTKTVTGGDWDTDDIVALGANAAAEYTDVIRLSYIQESRTVNVAASASDPKDYRHSVRFIASINTLDAKAAGFKISLNGGTEVEKETNVVYTSLKENTASGVIKELSAADGEYFVAITVTGIPSTLDSTYTYTVTPYYVDNLGETIYGAAYDVTYTVVSGANSVPFAQYGGCVAAN